jgi:hypothetical protein
MDNVRRSLSVPLIAFARFTAEDVPIPAPAHNPHPAV